jgi:type I restriction enzyme R subunit
MTKLIVLDEMIGSMTEFKQIIGRGTRLREKDGKSFFVVMDFRNVTRLFADPDWDGPIEIAEGFDPDHETPPSPDGPGDDPPPDPPSTKKYVVPAKDCEVHICGTWVSIYDSEGRLLTQESMIDYTRVNVLGKYASLNNFIHRWTAEEKKEAIRGLLMEQGIDLDLMKAEEGMSDVDDFDFICHVAFDQKPLTRRERAENVKKRDFLSRYGGVAREVLEALLEKYKNVGIYEIEKTALLQLDPFRRFGSPMRIAGYFGGKEGYLKAVRELEKAIYEGVG